MITLWKQLAPALCVSCHLFVVVKSTFLPFHSNLLDHSAVNWRVNTQRLLPASTVCFFFLFFCFQTWQTTSVALGRSKIKRTNTSDWGKCVMVLELIVTSRLFRSGIKNICACVFTYL